MEVTGIKMLKVTRIGFIGRMVHSRFSWRNHVVMVCANKALSAYQLKDAEV